MSCLLLQGGLILAAGPLPTTSHIASRLEVSDQPRELFIFGIEIGQRHAKGNRQSLLNLQGGLVDALLVAIDASAGDKFIDAHFYTQVALRDSASFPCLA
jgi:hypothetical protein